MYSFYNCFNTEDLRKLRDDYIRSMRETEEQIATFVKIYKDRIKDKSNKEICRIAKSIVDELNLEMRRDGHEIDKINRKIGERCGQDNRNKRTKGRVRFKLAGHTGADSGAGDTDRESAVSQ